MIILARLGSYRESYSREEATYENFHNVVLDEVHMPEDGWITKVSAVAGGYQMNTPAELVLYDVEEAGKAGLEVVLLHRSGTQMWNSILQERSSSLADTGLPGHEVRARKRKRLFFGLWGHPSYRRQFSVVDNNRQHKRSTKTFNSVPYRLETFSIESSSLAAWIDYIPNDAPRAGWWMETSPGGIVGEYRPLFEGTIRHPKSEGGRDRTSLVHVRIYDKTEGRYVYNRRFEPTDEENRQWYFSRRLYTHTPGHKYFAEFRHQDSWGVWQTRGNFGDRLHYLIGDGPERGVALSPADDSKINTLTPGFSGTYVHPEGIAAGNMQYQIWNRARTVTMFESDWTNMVGDSWVRNNTSSGYPMSLHQWGRPYSWRFRLTDINGFPSGWSRFADYRTNSAPYAPTRIEPSGGRTDSKGIISARVRDKDGDDIKELNIQITDKQTGNVLPGYPIKLTGALSNGSIVTYDASSDLTLTRTYQVEAWASDGTLIGEHSEIVEFLYDAAPDLNMISPTNTYITNEVYDPSFEYDLGWTINEVPGEVTIARVENGEAADGRWHIDFDRSVVGVGGGRIVSTPFNIDPTKSLYAVVETKKVSGVTDAIFQVVFYDAAGAITGVRRPVAVNGGLNSTDMEDYWQFYGGYVHASQIPAGSVTAELHFLPSFSSIARVFVDRMFAIAVETGADTFDGLDWFGYFDGDVVGYGAEDDYLWNGELGASASQGLSRLTDPAASITTSYFSETGALKAEDRVFIQKLAAGEYKQIYDSGWVASDRTIIPVNVGTFKNQGRYRVQARAKDQNNLVGNTEWVIVDVDYEGPPILNVEQVGQDPSTASISIDWEPTEIDPLTFLRYDVAVESVEEGEIIVAQIANQDETDFTYHAPVSNRVYDMKVRAVQLTGTTEVEGRWAGNEVSVDYYPYYFIKDMDDPSIMIPFEPLRGQIPGSKSNDPFEEYLPIDGQKPIHISGRARYESGSMEITLFDDDRLAGTGASYRLVLFDMAQNPQRGRKAIILSHLPGRKNFTALKGVDYSTNDILEPVVSIEWNDTMYVEDLILREGV